MLRKLLLLVRMTEKHFVATGGFAAKSEVQVE